MGENKFNKEAFGETLGSVRKEGGSATHRGEQRHREGRGLDPLVDPKGFGVIRRSLNRMEKKERHFVLTVGQAMLKETRFDTTGSMGKNVQLAFDVLPRSYNLLHEVDGAPLARYDLQIINASFGDIVDNYILCRTQAEMDVKIAEQLRLMVPEGEGGDSDEDPQYGLFGAAYLTNASIVRFGLKSYDFTVTDARGRDEIYSDHLVRVFGPDVLAKAKENGYYNYKDIPSTDEVVADLLKIAHAFLIMVGANRTVYDFWGRIYGRDRIVKVPDLKYLPEVEAAIIGLTEGVLDLQSLRVFLTESAQLPKDVVSDIVKAVAGIPIGAQAKLPNFAKIPVKGSKFANKGDVWPIGFTQDGQVDESAAKPEKPAAKNRSMWH